MQENRRVKTRNLTLAAGEQLTITVDTTTIIDETVESGRTVTVSLTIEDNPSP